jgi:hypothetical protein
MDCTSGATASDNFINPSGKLQAKCLCKAVQFNITRPNVPSDLDNQQAFPTSCQQLLRDETLGATRENTKCLTGLCACPSCRLASGFEIQPWAFVPQSNIFPHPTPDPIYKSSGPIVVLDLDAIPKEVPLSTYESSKGFIGISAGSVVQLYLCMRM